MPLFMVASAAESAPAATASSAPSWRFVVANLAAGATAGCAVEAGELKPGMVSEDSLQ